MSYTHLSFNERKSIEEFLNKEISFKQIAATLGRNNNTIAREVQRNSSVKRTGALGQPFNNCRNRWDCTQSRLCKKEDCKRPCCKGCPFCFRLCPEFTREDCKRLLLPPYVCNGCKQRHKCPLEKFLYLAKDAHKGYEQTLVAARDGIATTPAELIRLDQILSPLLKQGQSIHTILQSHKDEIMLDEKTIYRYVKMGLFSANVCELLHTVKMRPRKKKPMVKVERACREGRRYRDFLAVMAAHPDTPIVQLDTVIGAVGADEPVLLTIHFVEAELMLAFKRSANTAKSVTAVFNDLYRLLEPEPFRQLFPLCLTDNGSEFSNPSAIELDSKGIPRTKLFYTDPGAPYQKGACENNHSLIRRVLPKGTSLKPYSQQDINLIMNHINSYPRKKLKDRSAYDTFRFFHSTAILEKLGIQPIPTDQVTLNPTLLKK